MKKNNRERKELSMGSAATNKRANVDRGMPSGDAVRLRQLAAQFGVAASYVDEGGARRFVDDQSLRRILSVMGIEAQDAGQVTERMRESRSARW